MVCLCCNPVCVCANPLPETDQYSTDPNFGLEYVTNLTGRTRIPQTVTATISGISAINFYLWFLGIAQPASCPLFDPSALNGSYVLSNGVSGCGYTYTGATNVPDVITPGVTHGVSFVIDPKPGVNVTMRFRILILGCTTWEYDFLFSWSTWISKMCNSESAYWDIDSGTVNGTRPSPYPLQIELSPNPLP